eukprot:UC1_evm3s1424
MEFTVDRFGKDFDAEELIELVCRSATDTEVLSVDADGEFDPAPLLEAVETGVQDLWELSKRVQEEVSRLEGVAHRQQAMHASTLKSLDGGLTEAFDTLQELGDGIRTVSGKIVHVGEELEAVNLRKSRAESAIELARHFEAFGTPDGELLPPFYDFIETEYTRTVTSVSSRELHTAADVVQKLRSVLAELPEDRHSLVHKRVAYMRDKVEERLLAEARSCFADADALQSCLDTIYAFDFGAFAKARAWYIEAFIDAEHDMVAEDVWKAVEATCLLAKHAIAEVFRSPQPVLRSFVKRIVMRVVKKNYVLEELKDARANGNYLDALHSLYLGARDLVGSLRELFEGGVDKNFEALLLSDIFGDILEPHLEIELESLSVTYENQLSSYYESVGHTRPANSGRLGDRAEQAVQAARAVKTRVARVARHARSGSSGGGSGATGHIVHGSGGDDCTLLSQELTISLLDESQRAIARCADLAPKTSRAEWITRLFLRLLDGLCFDHLRYGLSVSLQRLPPKKPKSQPSLAFLDVLNDANSIFYLVQKHFQSTVLPLVRHSVTYYPLCVQKKNEAMERLESQLAIGIQYTLDAVVGWFRHILSHEQLKTDFRPVEDEGFGNTCTRACAMACEFLQRVSGALISCLNGRNLQAARRRLGTEIHVALMDHLRHHTFNTMGGMLLTKDLAKYGTLLEAWGDLFVTEL